MNNVVGQDPWSRARGRSEESGLTLEDGMLTLAGERSAEESGSMEIKYQRSERGVGQFYGRFVLPDTVDSDKVQATGKDGVLKVTISKQTKAMTRRIQIAA